MDATASERRTQGSDWPAGAPSIPDALQGGQANIAVLERLTKELRGPHQGQAERVALPVKFSSVGQ